MRTLSLDLRERILASYDNNEGTRLEVAERFKVSEGMVKKLLQQRRRTGDIRPCHRNSGRKPVIVNAHRQNIRWLLGHCCYLQGDEAESRALYDDALRVDPETLDEERDKAWLRLRTAEDHAAHGRMGEAVSEMRAALAGGIHPKECRCAIVINPRLDPEQRQELLQVCGGQ